MQKDDEDYGLSDCPDERVQCTETSGDRMGDDCQSHECTLTCAELSQGQQMALAAEEGRKKAEEIRKKAKDEARNKFCIGKTDMFMDGFKTLLLATGPDQCLILFHPKLVLNSWWKFLLGWISIVLLGMICEFVVRTRRDVRPDLRTWKGKSVKCSLYALNMTLGYLLMLVPMMYSVEMFVAAIVGLAAGHVLFNLTAPVSDSVTACCAGRNTGGGNNKRHQEPLLLSQEGEGGVGVGIYPHATIMLGAKKHVRLSVAGMTCGNCEATVRSALKMHIPLEWGGKVGEISHRSQIVEVFFENAPENVDVEATLIKEIESIGFDVVGPQSTPAKFFVGGGGQQ